MKAVTGAGGGGGTQRSAPEPEGPPLAAQPAPAGWFERVRALPARAQEAKVQAGKIIGAFQRLDDKTDGELVEGFEALLGLVRRQQDRRALAHTIGVVSEGGLGIYFFRGRFLRYVRADSEHPARLCLGTMMGLGERISLSGGLRVYQASTYGPPEDLAPPKALWHSAEAGLGPLAGGIIRGAPRHGGLRGLIAWVGIDFSLGVPPLSGLALLHAGERVDREILLPAGAVERLEALLASAPDLAALRKLAGAKLPPGDPPLPARALDSGTGS